jgi:hypothetical protein
VKWVLVVPFPEDGVIIEAGFAVYSRRERIAKVNRIYKSNRIL